VEEKILLELASALEKARQEGQPIDELLTAVKDGAELDAWFEPKENGSFDLIIAVREE